jgi:hypothetical protein
VRDPAVPAKPPGTVVAAAVVTVVTAALTVLCTLLISGVALWVRAPILETSATQNHPRWSVGGFAVVVIGWSVVAAWLAWQVTRGHNWARRALAGSALMTIGFSMVLVTLVLPVATLVAGVVVVVLLFTGRANEWFRSVRSRP